MADGWLPCHKAGAEEGSNQPTTMNMNKNPKGKILGSSSVSLGIEMERSKGRGWKALNYTRERLA
jgi:hypothetical protein